MLECNTRSYPICSVAALRPIIRDMQREELQDFSQAQHTIVLSDIHLTEAEPQHPRNPLWKKYKTRELFIDESFARFLDSAQKEMTGPIELVLNGDIFDFDAVMTLPPAKDTHFTIKKVEKKRGLFAEEKKSRFKIEVILSHHPVWVKAIQDFLKNGHRLVFVIGNHDVELHWPEVQEWIKHTLAPTEESAQRLRFCEWFFISNGDSLIEHGNQYDFYTVCQNPINPLIRSGDKVRVRLPFGNLAARFMINGMGFFNPHADNSFIRGGAEYLRFFVKYVMRTEPFLLYTWFWGAMHTLWYSLKEGLKPALVDPLTVENTVEWIAKKANGTPQMVRALRETHVHSAIFHPIEIMRELWLDRAFLFMLIFLVSFQLYSFFALFIPVSFWWFGVPFLLFMPFFILYARSVESNVTKLEQFIMRKIGQSAQLCGVSRVILGHTHKELFVKVNEVDLLNSGTWSAAFEDVECERPTGRKCFVWLKPEGGKRVAQLCEWKDPSFLVLTGLDLAA